MKFFFPDSQDQIDPWFDFATERSPEFRVRQRDDRYAHEVLKRRAYDGLLVSKPIVDGLNNLSGKYTAAQRHRLYRLGVRRFFRLDQPGWPATTMGDCGSFTYVREEEPPYSIDEVIDFYESCTFDLGVAIDHVIFGYDETDRSQQLPEWRRRQALSLDLANSFLQRTRNLRCHFHPIGAAQGWSPRSYAESVQELQHMGYTYIALGGMVPLKTPQIDACLRAITDVRRRDTQLHLLGISRASHIPDFGRYGVTSFDSTSPFRQAFKDDKDNYYTPQKNYLAIRVPQLEGNVKLKAAIVAGLVDQTRARTLERDALDNLVAYDAGDASLERALDAVLRYSELIEPTRSRREAYREVLEAAPWKHCDCGVCQEVGIQVVIFRGTERNKRRGFHNLAMFSGRLTTALPTADSATVSIPA